MGVFLRSIQTILNILNEIVRAIDDVGRNFSACSLDKRSPHEISLDLMQDLLSEKEWSHYREHRTIMVDSMIWPGRIRYELGRFGIIWVLEGSDWQARNQFCITPVSFVPIPDEILAKKYFIQGDEHAFLDIANISELDFDLEVNLMNDSVNIYGTEYELH